MGIFSSKKSVSESPEIDVKTQPLIRPGWWISNRLPKPSSSTQPQLTGGSDMYQYYSDPFPGSDGTYTRQKRSDSIHLNDADGFTGHEETYRNAKRSDSYHQNASRDFDRRRGAEGTYRAQSAYRSVKAGASGVSASAMATARAQAANARAGVANARKRQPVERTYSSAGAEGIVPPTRRQSSFAWY